MTARLFDPPSHAPCATHGTLAVWLSRERLRDGVTPLWRCLICEAPLDPSDAVTVFRRDEFRPACAVKGDPWRRHR